jgi:hypothetical protein
MPSAAHLDADASSVNVCVCLLWSAEGNVCILLVCARERAHSYRKRSGRNRDVHVLKHASESYAEHKFVRMYTRKIVAATRLICMCLINCDYVCLYVHVLT